MITKTEIVAAGETGSLCGVALIKIDPATGKSVTAVDNSSDLDNF
jgi:hypothetical protein